MELNDPDVTGDWGAGTDRGGDPFSATRPEASSTSVTTWVGLRVRE